MATYSIWESRDDDGTSLTLVPDGGPPRFADGRLQDADARLVKAFEAATWEDALRVRSELYGWTEPTAPLSPPAG
jgi:hypothetical protein